MNNPDSGSADPVLKQWWPTNADRKPRDTDEPKAPPSAPFTGNPLFHCDPLIVEPMLKLLRKYGVREFSVDKIVFDPLAPLLPVSVAPSVPLPSTPEQSGKADQFEEPPPKDFFDVLSSGLIPGAPTRDGLSGDPSTG